MDVIHQLKVDNLFSNVVVIFLFLTLISTIPASSSQERFARELQEKEIMRVFNKHHEKLSHFHFFFHDIIAGRERTAVRVAEAPILSNASATAFGIVVVMDNALTVGPNITSKLVGRAQGIYASASREVVGLLMVLNFAFVEGKYNGSTLSVLGRNEVFLTVREMPIVGGSGVFRFARGYALAKTYAYNPETRDAVVEYNVYVLHY